MSWSILCVLVVPLLYMASNLADKFQLHGNSEDSEPGALMALGSIYSIVFMVPIGLWLYVTNRALGGLESVLPLLFNELLYIAGIWIYLSALKTEETSKVVPWFQTIPAFGLIGAFALIGEKIEMMSIVAIAFLMAGGFLLAFHQGKLNRKLVGRMLASSVILALYDVIFAKYGRDIDPFSAIFINVVGKALWSAVFLIGKRERSGFLVGLQTRFKTQSIAEITAILADLAMCVCLLYLPVALVQGLCCTQPLFVLGGAAILTKAYPWIIVEDVQGLTMTQKAIGISMMVAGGILLSI